MKRDRRNTKPIVFPCSGLVPLPPCPNQKPGDGCWYCLQGAK